MFCIISVDDKAFFNIRSMCSSGSESICCVSASRSVLLLPLSFIKALASISLGMTPNLGGVSDV